MAILPAVQSRTSKPTVGYFHHITYTNWKIQTLNLFFQPNPSKWKYETEKWIGQFTESWARQSIWQVFKQSLPDKKSTFRTGCHTFPTLSGSLEASLDSIKKCLFVGANCPISVLAWDSEPSWSDLNDTPSWSPFNQWASGYGQPWGRGRFYSFSVASK